MPLTSSSAAWRCVVVVVTLVAAPALAFTTAPQVAFSRSSSSAPAPAPTRLFISSWGKEGSPYTGGGSSGTLERENPEENVVSYLPEAAAVEARSNLQGTCLVSGLIVRDESRATTDQFLFDLLHHEESAFEFTALKAIVPDVAFAKKRLLSRSARYTGLLDQLEFEACSSEDTSLPTAAQLEGVTSWVAYVESDHLTTLAAIAALTTAAPSVENVVILLAAANELPANESAAALALLEDAVKANDKFSYTIVVVGDLDETTPEGKDYYQFEDFGTTEGVLPAATVFSREEAYRMTTELLQLACGKNRALAFAPIYQANVTEARLLRGLRQAGYARPQEIDHMIREGPAAYQDYVNNWKKENPDVAAGYTTDAWWEADIYQESRRKTAARAEEDTKAVSDERTKEIESIAKEWAKREYFRQSMAGTIAEGTSEEDFTKQVWDRAVFEGDIKYRQMKGETTDADSELVTFQDRQERKKQTMLQRAKDDLANLLDEDGQDSEELKKKWEEDEDTMDQAGKDDTKGY